jgi:drug/metabolite transporter (DMT)-like permease
MPSALAIGTLLTVVSAFGFGSGALFAKPVYAAGVDWHVLMSWRFLIGAARSWALIASRPSTRDALRRTSRRTILVAISLGVLYTGNSGTYYAGLETVPASLAALIVFVYPAIVAVIALQVGQPLSGRRAWIALAIALSGVALAVGNIDQSTAPPIGGLLLIVASPFIYSIWIILAARLGGEDREGVGHDAGDGADPIVAGAIMLTATAATYWVSALATGQEVLPQQVPSAAWFGIAGVGIVSTFIAVQAFYAATHRIGAARASLISTVEPVWTIVLAGLLFGESLGPLQVVGGALILAAVVIAQTSTANPTASKLRIADE